MLGILVRKFGKAYFWIRINIVGRRVVVLLISSGQALWLFVCVIQDYHSGLWGGICCAITAMGSSESTAGRTQDFNPEKYPTHLQL